MTMLGAWLLIGSSSLAVTEPTSVADTSKPAAEWINPIQQDDVYQYSVPIGNDVDHRAYMWIPPDCKHVRGLLIGAQNMQEEPFFEDLVIRKACAESGIGIVWFSPGDDVGVSLYKTFKPGAADGVQKALADLAKVSGYSEVENAPLLATAHSASTPFVWGMADAFSSRMIAILPLKGWFTGHMTPGIPALHISSEYGEVGGVNWGETYLSDRKQIARLRSEAPDRLIGEAVDIGAGHYEWDSHFAPVIAMFIKKSAQYRLPSNEPLTGPVMLKAIDPASGWLIDPDKLGTPGGAGSSYKDWTGDPTTGLWYYDKEMAKTVNDYIIANMAKKPQVVDFLDKNGQPIPLITTGVSYLDVTWLPDNASFNVSATYLDKSPTTKLYDGQSVGHSTAPILFKVSTGGIKQTGPNTFRMWMKRGGVVQQGSPWEPTLMAYSEGDSEYRRADRPGHPWLKLVNTTGTPQTITFNKISDVTTKTKQITLSAVSSSGLPVQFFTVSGPVEISDSDNTKLTFQRIPPRSAFPVHVIVGAYQWGRTVAPQIQNGGPVYQEFLIQK